MALPAAGIAFWLTAGVTAALLMAILVLAPLVLYFAVFDNGQADIDDVERFRRLTEGARDLARPNGSSPNGHSAEGIERFQAKKDEARRALRATQAAHRARPAQKPSGVRR